jgi:putative membrane protein
LDYIQLLDNTTLLLTFSFLILYVLLLVKLSQFNRMIIKKFICFVLGLVLINLCFGSALNFYSHLLLSVHMFQMSLICFFIPLLILSGLSGILEHLQFRLFNQLRNNKIYHHSILGFFALIFTFYHFPVVFNTIMSHKALHDFSQGFLMLLSFLVWWPATTASYNEKSNKLKRNYIHKMLILLMPACLFLIIANTELYKVYSDPIFLNETLRVCFSPDIDVKQQFIKFYSLSNIGDQKLGGSIMLISHKLASYWLLRG